MKKTCSLVSAVLLLLALAAPARAARIIDEEPAMTWGDLLACKLVVVGKYASHKAGVLSLKVQRILKTPSAPGEAAPVKAGDVIERGACSIGGALKPGRLTPLCPCKTPDPMASPACATRPST